MDAETCIKKGIIEYIQEFEKKYAKELSLLKVIMSDPDILKII